MKNQNGYSIVVHIDNSCYACIGPLREKPNPEEINELLREYEKNAPEMDEWVLDEFNINVVENMQPIVDYG